MSQKASPPDRPLGRGHPLVERLRRLARSAADREDEGIMLIEGIRLAEEALASRLSLEAAVASPRLTRTERGERLLAAIKDAGVPLWRGEDRLLESLGDAESHQGILLVGARPSHRAEDLIPDEGPALLVVTLGIQDPGNTGAIVRIAEAAGGCGVLALGGADPFGPKAARASAGSIFRLPVARVAGEEAPARGVALCRARRLSLFGAAPHGGTEIHQARLPERLAVLFGAEGAGFGGEILPHLEGTLSIRMQPPVESLNVAAAAAVVLFEAARRLAPA